MLLVDPINMHHVCICAFPAFLCLSLLLSFSLFLIFLFGTLKNSHVIMRLLYHQVPEQTAPGPRPIDPVRGQRSKGSLTHASLRMVRNSHWRGENWFRAFHGEEPAWLLSGYRDVPPSSSLRSIPRRKRERGTHESTLYPTKAQDECPESHQTPGLMVLGTSHPYTALRAAMREARSAHAHDRESATSDARPVIRWHTASSPILEASKHRKQPEDIIRSISLLGP